MDWSSTRRLQGLSLAILSFDVPGPAIGARGSVLPGGGVDFSILIDLIHFPLTFNPL